MQIRKNSLPLQSQTGTPDGKNGVLAQLVERLNGIQKVRSSILLCSTKKPVAKTAGFFVQQAVLTPALRAAPSQPKNHKAGQCGSGTTGRHIGMLCEPNSSGGASRSATGVLRMRVKMLCEFQVSSFPGAGGVFGVGPAPTIDTTGANSD